MRYLILILLISSLFACKNRNIQKSGKADIEARDLYITAIVSEQNCMVLPKAYKINLSNGRYTIAFDVNTCSGTYSIKKNEIKFNACLHA